MSKFIRINELIIHSAPSNRTISLDSSQRIIMIKNNFTDQNSCGVISERYFNTRLEHVLESINYNSCLNKKISVDTKGQIKNCPSMENAYGTIYDNTISNVLSNKDFEKPWYINKDSIEVCKDCEFRYICTDCRAYLGSDISKKKPSKCIYNPYLEI